MLKSALAACLFAAATSASAQERVTAFDIAVDFRNFTDRIIIVTGCTVNGAQLEWAFCEVASRTGRIGQLLIDTGTMERETLRFILNECAGYDPRPACRLDLQARIEIDDGEPVLTDVRRVEPD